MQSTYEVLELCGGTTHMDSLNVPKLVDKYLQACLKPTKHTATGQELLIFPWCIYITLNPSTLHIM